jgi:hypothetical protein
MTADVQEQDIILALFGGPGGSVRLLSLLRQRLLIAADILYHGKRPSFTGWYFELSASFDNWTRRLEECGILPRQAVRHPILLQLDVREPELGLINSVDKIVIDPPFGNVSERLLGITKEESKQIFLSSLKLSENYLTGKGKATCSIPREWLNEKILDQTNLRVTFTKVIGASERFAIVQLEKIAGE